ncbi:MAG: hypothetical protein AAGE01_07715 [Pseudomonadota bacterium]
MNKAVTLQGGHAQTNWNAVPDPTTSPTTLDDNGQECVLRLAAGTIGLENLEIVKGAAAIGGRPIVDNNTVIRSNSADVDGGGVYNDGKLTVTDTVIQQNTLNNALLAPW